MSTAITTPQTSTNDWEAILPTIRHMCANGATDPEFKIFCETARTLGLNPMLKQIWCVKNLKRPDLPAQVYASRDGLIAIAHRSGQFDGMESGTKTNENGEMVGYCRIWRKDMSHPFYVEVLRKEYDTGKNLWETHPATMTEKVAQAHALKLAFDICGVYIPDEMGQDGERASDLIRRADFTRPIQEVEIPTEALSEGAAQFAGNIADMTHCYECGEPIDPTREGMVSKRDHGRYLCLKHLKLANQELEAASNPAPKSAAHPAAPKAVAEEERDQPSSSPLASTIARINAEQEAIDQQTKKPMPPLKPDPNAGKVNTCQTCGASITQEQARSSLAAVKYPLCQVCQDLKQDIDSKKPAVKA